MISRETQHNPSPSNDRPKKRRVRRRRGGDVRRFRRVAIQIADDSSLNRAKIRGILEYLQKRRQWEIPFANRFPSLTEKELPHWDGDGVIGDLLPRLSAVSALRQSGVVVVNTAAGLDETLPLPLPTVCVDSPGIGRLAAEHLLSRKLRRYAFAGVVRSGASRKLHYRRRGIAFVDTLRAHGFLCTSFWAAHHRHADVLTGKCWKSFVGGLERPVGIFACSDQVGFGILRTCRVLGIRVPEEVAVISVDDDEALCHLAIPRMTSIDPCGERVGYRAAELLDRLMDGKEGLTTHQVIPPGEVRFRESTDVLCTSNREVAEALRFIRAHIHEPITAEDVVHVVTISRRTLERYFREATGQGIHEAIRGMHLDMARSWLAKSNASLKEIAHRSGFRNADRMNDAFRSVMGFTASEFRQRRRDSGNQ